MTRKDILRNKGTWRKILGFQIGEEVSFATLASPKWRKGIIVAIWSECSPPRYSVKVKEEGIPYILFKEEMK